MKIEELHLEHFRNIPSLDLKFGQDFIVLVGPNGVGKTSILESLHYSSLLQAFPPGKSWELIEFGQDFFRITLKTVESKFEYYYGKKTAKKFVRSQSIDGARKRSAEIIGMLPTISFLPTDLNLLSYSPAGRRDYLDEVLLQANDSYENILSDLSQTLSQRNELLFRIREGSAKESELDIWDDKLLEYASPIIEAREQLIDFLNSELEELYETVTGDSREMVLQYIAPYIRNGETLEDSLARARRNDIASAATSVGPHRDDFRFEDGEGRNLARYFSRGEQRSAIICLKLKEFTRIKQQQKKTPIVLFDELLAELDDTRKAQVLKNLPPKTQVFLTTTSDKEIPEDILKKAQILELKK